MKTTTACTLLLAIGLFVSCNQAEKKSEDLSISHIEMSPALETTENKGFGEGSLEQTTVMTDSIAQTPVQSTTAKIPVPPPTIDWDKKIIKNATVKYEVKSFDNFNKEVREKVRKYGGYIAQEENFEYDDRKEISMVIKVPVAQFEPAINDMQNKDAKQVERTIKTDDVTGQVVDTKSRLEAKKQMRLKYMEFLQQSKNMEEVLKVQSEINGIQEEIEAAQGRVQYLTNSSAYSTINLNFYQPFENFKVADKPTDPSFFTKTGEAFSRGADMVKGLLLVIVRIWPLLLAVLVAWLYWRRRKVSAPAAVK